MALNTHSIDFGTPNTTKYLSHASAVGTTVGGNVTIEAWVNVTTLPTSPQQDTIVRIQPGATSPYVDYGILYWNNGGTPTLRFSRGRMCVANAFTDVAQTLTIGTWFHVAMTYDGTSIRGYVNGTLVVGPTAQSGDGASCGADSFNIGADAGGGADTFLRGLVDDVRVWTTVRTATEINDNKSIQIDTATGLVGSWHLNNALTDSSGGARTLTNNGTASFSTNVPFAGTADAVATSILSLVRSFWIW